VNDSLPQTGPIDPSCDQVGILVVDDHPDKLLSIQALLSDLGRVVCASSGREALRRLLTEQFAVILLDINMPGMDGFETASIIRQRKSTEHTPIIFLTAFGDEIFVARGYSLGAVDYIQTPVVPDVLRTKVSVFVDLHRKSEQLHRQARRLEQRTSELADLAVQATQAEQRERRRLARLLHDHLQQLLVAANMRLSLAIQSPPSGQREIFDQVEQLITQAIEASRSLTTQLSPPILYDAGLVPALQWLARRMQEDHDLLARIHADHAPSIMHDDLRALIFEVVRELLFNIVKHADVKTADVHVSEPAEGTVRIVVQDTGRGFDPALLRSGADRFGLFSIRQRIHLLNGRFEIDSAPGRGTQVNLELPVPTAAAPVDEPPAGDGSADAAPHRDAPRLAGPRIRVILADDHEILRKGLAGLIGGQPDMEVVAEASNGAEAVKLAHQVDAEVVVMDVSMPLMSGVEATRRLMQIAPHLRVIGLSMHEEDSMAAAMRQAGAAAYLTKDGPPDALMMAIRAVRNGRPAADGSSLPAEILRATQV
jgi:DNA-binding NarL/FixJ family response regulator